MGVKYPGGVNLAQALRQAGGVRGVGYGGSLMARTHSYWDVGVAKYTRSGGVAQWATTGMPWRRIPGHKFRLAAVNKPEVEGLFEVLSQAQAGNVTTTNFLDPRPDYSGGLTGGGTVQDVFCPSFAGSWAQWAKMFAGADITLDRIGIGGAGIDDLLLDSRLQQLRDAAAGTPSGRFDFVLINAGGNTVASPGGLSAPAIVLKMVQLIDAVVAATGAREVGLMDLPAIRGAAANTDKFTRGRLVSDGWYNYLQRLRPNVRIIDGSRHWPNRWQPYTDGSINTDLANGWPTTKWLDPDDTHQAFGGSIRYGMPLGEWFIELYKMRQGTARDYPDTRLVATAADNDGGLSSNLLPTWYGPVTTVALPGGGGPTGTVPQYMTASMANAAGGATVKGSMRQHPLGQAEVVFEVTDKAPGATGLGVATSWAPPQLVTALNLAANQGVDLQLAIDAHVRPAVDNTVQGVNLCVLYGTVGGTEFPLAAVMLDQGGLGQMSVLGRAMDTGFGGPVPSDYFQIKPGTVFDSARIAPVELTHVPGAAMPASGGAGTYYVIINGAPTLRRRTGQGA